MAGFNASAASTVTSTGLGAGLDVGTIVDQYIQAARQPEVLWQQQQQQLQLQTAALTAMNGTASSLSDNITSLKDTIAGAFSAITANSSAPAVVTASAATGAVTGQHIIRVSNLASTASYYTAAQASSSTPLATGSFNIQLGNSTPATVTVDSTNNTLDGLASSINAMDIGVTASVVTDSNGARLALVSKNSGAASDITISGDTTGLGFTKGTTGADASLTVDGVPVSSASNTVSGALAGITLNLVTASPGQDVVVTVAPDTSGVSTAINNFVNNFNKLVSQINNQFTYDPNQKTSGPLSGDSTVRQVQQELLSAVSFSMSGNGSISTLRSLGLEMQDDGTLTVNSATLNDALQNHYADVQNFFQSSSGFGNFFGGELSTLTDTTDGAFTVDIHGVNNSVSSLQDRIDSFELYISSKQQQLTDQYNRINVMLQAMPQQQAQLKAELGGA
jgi:flagellar hook-associated protein 2